MKRAQVVSRGVPAPRVGSGVSNGVGMIATDGEPRATLADLRRAKRAQTKVRRATELLERLRRDASEVAAIRAAAVTELHEAGLSYAQIADIAGVSRARVAQIVQDAGART